MPLQKALDLGCIWQFKLMVTLWLCFQVMELQPLQDLREATTSRDRLMLAITVVLGTCSVMVALQLLRDCSCCPTSPHFFTLVFHIGLPDRHLSEMFSGDGIAAAAGCEGGYAGRRSDERHPARQPPGACHAGWHSPTAASCHAPSLTPLPFLFPFPTASTRQQPAQPISARSLPPTGPTRSMKIQWRGNFTWAVGCEHLEACSHPAAFCGAPALYTLSWPCLSRLRQSNSSDSIPAENHRHVIP